MIKKPRHITAALLLAPPLLSSAALLHACNATHHHPASAQATEPERQPRFASEIKRQLRHPDTLAEQAPPPPNLPSHLTVQFPAQDAQRAAHSLESILEEFKTATPIKTPPGTTDQRLTGNKLEALRAYTRGRTLMLTEGAVTAEPEFRAAAKLDPDAAEPWQALAEAQTELGATTAAITSYKRALDRDPANTAALERLAYDAFNRRDNILAIEYLTRLKSLDLLAFDPALPNIVDLRLGHALTAMGYAAAGAQAYIAACDLPTQFRDQSHFLSDLSNLYRQRPLLLTRAGDTFLRLNRFNDAEHAYALADSIPSSDDLHQVLTRRLYTTLKTGHSASAAQALFDRLESRNGLVDDALLDLFRHVSHHSKAQHLIESALTERLDAATSSNQRLQSAHLAAARAVCLPADRIPAALRDTLRDYPTHTYALRALLAASTTESERIAETIALIDAHPEYTSIYTDELLGAHPASFYIDLLPADDTQPASALLRASLYLDAAQPTRALDALKPITPAHNEVHNQAAILHASINHLLARPDLISEQLDSLPPLGTSPECDLARARIHLLSGRTSRALSALSPHLDQGETLPPQFLTTVAFIYEIRGDAETARTLCEQAIEADPTNDTPYRRLLALLRPTGAAPDVQAYTDTYRELRAHIPWSSAVAFERVVSDLQGGQRERAEQTLRQLVVDAPREHNAWQMLADLMFQRAEYEPLARLLGEQVERSPLQSGLIVRQARVLTAEGKTEAAAELLAQRLAELPGDDEASRALERLLRDDLGRGGEADDLAFARLERNALLPESLLELFELYLEHNREQDALAALDRYFALDGFDRQAFSARLVGSLAKLAQRRGVDANAAVDVLALLDRVLDHRPDAPEVVHLLRLDRLIQEPGTATDLTLAIDLLVEQYPAQSPVIFDRVGQNLLRNAIAAWDGQDLPRRKTYGELTIGFGVHSLELFDPPRIETLGLLLGGAHNIAHSPADRDRAASHIVAMLRLADERFDRDALIDAYSAVLTANPSAGVHAQVYAWLGDALSDTSQDAQCEALYRACIRLDPNHIMSLNNLGYRLVERGEDLDEAHALLTRSYDQMQRNPEVMSEAVIDSLGWVRYKLGMIKDGGDDKGAVIRGAVTLLRTALQLSRDQARSLRVAGRGDEPDEPNLATITVVIVASHYGDALWADGQRERAIEIWREAYEKSSALIRALRQGTLPKSTLDEVEAVRSSCGEKMQAAADDREPLVEPIAYDLRPAADPVRPDTDKVQTGHEQDENAF